MGGGEDTCVPRLALQKEHGTFRGAGLRPRESLLWGEQRREAGPGTVNLMGQLAWAAVPCVAQKVFCRCS